MKRYGKVGQISINSLSIQFKVVDLNIPGSNLSINLARIELARFKEMPKQLFEQEGDKSALDARRYGEIEGWKPR